MKLNIICTKLDKIFFLKTKKPKIWTFFGLKSLKT